MRRKRARKDTTAEIVFATEEVGENPLGGGKSQKMTPQQATDVECNAPLVSGNSTARKDHSTIPTRRKLMVILFGIIFITGIAIVRVTLLPSKGRHQVLYFSCPSNFTKSANDIPTENEEYERVTNQIKSNMTHYMQTFRNSSFDSWGRKYERIKKGMYHWKSTRVDVENGDSIYESACGIGMNLYMTLEILYEVKGIESLVVNGNDYVPLSAQVANTIWDEYPLLNAQKGTICAGDSANLDFVPSNAFDLVYTGYITPINDPLHLHKGDMDQNLKFYKGLCQGKDQQSMKLSAMAQRAQEDFYGKWIGEMVRIAKPGKPVIVEQVSMPYCEEEYDWGGVGREWWEPAIAKYGWDIDPSSLEMEKDTIFHNRYHVFMRKNPP